MQPYTVHHQGRQRRNCANNATTCTPNDSEATLRAGPCCAKVTLTFGWAAHQRRLVAMATVSGDESPAPALPQTVLVATATQPLIVEDARARVKLQVVESRSDVAAAKRQTGGWESAVRQAPSSTAFGLSTPTSGPAACRSHWRPGPTSESHTPPPTGRSGTPLRVRCQQRSCPPDEQHLKTPAVGDKHACWCDTKLKKKDKTKEQKCVSIRQIHNL